MNNNNYSRVQASPVSDNFQSRPLRIAINGFGRIGRNFLRAVLERTALNPSLELNDITVVAINDVADATSLVHLLNYDSTHGRLSDVGYYAQLHEHTIIISKKSDRSSPKNDEFLRIDLYSEKNPAHLPWADLVVDVVIESSGMFRSYESASKHIRAGAQKVIVGAAPFDTVDASIVMGVNESELTLDKKIISSVSCTTQALVPLLHTLNSAFSIESAMMTEIHAVTADQNVLDQGHRDLRRSRASGSNIIPTTSSSIAATVRVLPYMKDRINGHSIRVPTINVAAIDVTLQFSVKPTLSEIKELLQETAHNNLKGILGYTHEPLVSSDFIHQSESLIIDEQQVMEVGEQIKIFAWYDNEWGYANRLVDMCLYINRLYGDEMTKIEIGEDVVN